MRLRASFRNRKGKPVPGGHAAEEIDNVLVAVMPGVLIRSVNLGFLVAA